MEGSATLNMTEDARAAAEKRKRDFERSLAGPSVGKAGLMRDQTEVNRIIAEASKGSKFYINQVRKDEEVTRKVKWFQEKRDELLKAANLERLQADADHILAEVEATRDLSQTIIHVDMDAFYAAVETQRDPSLKGKPFGVGKGVLTTASYEARKFGCRSGMAGFVARKLCPQIILTKLHFDLYIEASKKVREVLVQYDENLMMASLDEGHLNITPYMATHGMTAAEVVTQLRAEVEAATQLTISAGIAPNRMLAKICSDQNKPNGQFELEFERTVITKFMRDLPVRKIPGFGRVTERFLEGLGIETCGDVYGRRGELLVMNHWFDFRGLCKAYLGIASNRVEPSKREERKSVGVERTFRDKWEEDDIMRTLEEIAEELEQDMKRLQYSGRTITVKYKLHTYESKTRAHSIKKFVQDKEDILPIALELMRKELPVRVRLLGIRVTGLKDLTVEDKGIKTFFGNSKKPVPSRPTESIDLTLDDDEEDGANPFDYDTAAVDLLRQAGSEGDDDSPGLSLDSSPRKLGLSCPICNESLGEGTSNADLNEHVDMCLNRDAFAGDFPSAKESPQGSPRKRRGSSTDSGGRAGKRKARGAKAQAGSSVLDWLKRRP